MLRFTTATSLLIVALCFTTAADAQSNRNTIPAETAGRAQVRPASAQAKPAEDPLPQDLERLLIDWANASSQIQRLEGEHLRRVYDYTFEVEKLSEGKFYFEFPDKGRIDVTPYAINQQLIAQRNAGQILAPKNAQGQVFALKADSAEQWICDGRRVYDMNVEMKQCDIVQLPPQLQGANIMDSPLPFLFGMPPDKAKRRYDLKFASPYNQASGVAMITAKPKLPQDAQNWQQADVKLDLTTFLPRAVRLTDPAGTQITTYTFSNLVVNNQGGWKQLLGLKPQDMFKPDLTGWTINMLGNDGEKLNVNPGPLVVPNVVGKPYQQAVTELEGLGLQRKENPKTILLTPGPVARRAEDVFTVESQIPEAGTPLTPQTAVKLVLWNKPTQASQ